MYEYGILTILLLFLHWIWNQRAKKLNIKGPKQVPFIGNTFDVEANAEQLNKWLYDMTLEHGDTFHGAIMTQPPFVFTAGIRNFEYILKTNFENFPKGEAFITRMEDFLGRGIFNADGDGWKMQRKHASQMFTMRAMRDNMSHIFIEHLDKVYKLLDNYAEHDITFDLQDLFYRYTLDSICKIAFGVDLHCLEQKEVPFMNAFDFAQKIIDKRFLTGSWKFKRLFGIGDEGRMKQALNTIHEFANLVIQERKKLSEEELSRNIDLLSYFLQQNKDENGEPFSDKYLIDIVLNFIIAGRDTTAQALSWCFYELSKHPHIEQKCADEIVSVLGANGIPTYDRITNELHYLHHVIQETLRLHPSVPKELKSVVKDCTLPDGTFVPAGSCVIPLLQVSMRLKHIWGDDALEFKPERFQDGEPSPYKFVAFQAGPRTCLGKPMAYLEAETVLAGILQRYKIVIEPSQKVEEEIALTLPMRYPLYAQVQKRKYEL